MIIINSGLNPLMTNIGGFLIWFYLTKVYLLRFRLYFYYEVENGQIIIL